MKDDNAPKASEYQVVCSGPAAQIRLAPGARAQYRQVLDGTDQISVKRRTHLGRYFREFCDSNPHRLTQEKFKKEGNFPDGRGGEVAIWEFKAWQWRLYGSILAVSGNRCFVGVRVDASKKSDRANQQLLRSAATDIAALAEYRTKK